MPIIKTSTVVTKEIPASVIDVLSDPPETWSAKQLTGSRQRVLWEIMNSQDFSSFSSFLMTLAWLSFAGSTIKTVDEDGKEELLFGDNLTIEEFSKRWDMLGDSLIDWIIGDVVFEANPQWDDRAGKKKNTDEKKT